MYYKKRRRKGFVSIGDDNRRREGGSTGRAGVSKGVVIDKYDYISGCWWMVSPYAKFKGKLIYQAYAAGEGYLARHLCCDKHCINPMHLLRGTNYDNAQDEVYMRDQFGRDLDYRLANKLPIIDEMAFRKIRMKELVTENLMRIPLDWVIEEQLTYANTLMEELRDHNKINILEA